MLRYAQKKKKKTPVETKTKKKTPVLFLVFVFPPAAIFFKNAPIQKPPHIGGNYSK